MADGAKPDVPTTDQQNEKKKKHRPFYEAVDAYARRRLIIFYRFRETFPVKYRLLAVREMFPVE